MHTNGVPFYPGSRRKGSEVYNFSILKRSKIDCEPKRKHFYPSKLERVANQSQNSRKKLQHKEHRK